MLSDFLFRYENYVLPTPGPEIVQVQRSGKVCTLQYYSWLHGAVDLSLELPPRDTETLFRLVTQEIDFFALPETVEGSYVLLDGDWPRFTLRYAGQEHSSGGPCAGYWNTTIDRLQEAMHQLFTLHILPLLPAFTPPPIA
ncbi:hypothetical protein [Hymenobacter weizhouensis]|uniref:hypothetical protein n=1 Tax=Hymenobacter sp. YIM 151500-1 TaxID=2987689 RepID=UPI0022268085|nr:hypothetical protein [Hymenobacter sp. YIM 151500-1]UYZ63560.1 hypothetical protein OIS53_01655 [Hymenobacter sp. YIM 151500-1]